MTLPYLETFTVAGNNITENYQIVDVVHGTTSVDVVAITTGGTFTAEYSGNTGLRTGRNDVFVRIYETNFETGQKMLIETYTVYVDVATSLPCFLIGSKILTNKGYIPVENLRKGDLVKTLKNDYLPIVLIGKSPIYNSGDSDRIKNRLYNLSVDKYSELTEDLVLTGCHSLLVDILTKQQEDATLANYGEFKITEGKVRLETYLDDKADPYPEKGTFTIYHLALENENYFSNYGIWANGLLVESCSKRYLTELSGMELID